jgi:hypothetical protein
VAVRLVSILLSAVLILGVCGDASAKTDVLRTLAGRTIRWVYRDITVGVDTGAPSRTVSAEGVREAMRAAVEVWNEVPELPVHFVLTNTSAPAVRVRFCHTTWRGEQDDLGKATFTADVETGEVSSAVVELNECGYAFLPPEQAQDGRFDLQAVLTHELGHVLGLGHSNNPEALMYIRGGTAGVRTPKLDDRAAIAVVYDTALVTPPPQRQRFASTLLPPEPASRVPSPLDKMLSDQVVTAMRIADDNGRSLVIFTCEPTLLPAISSLQNDNGPQSPKGRTRRIRTAHAPSPP